MAKHTEKFDPLEVPGLLEKAKAGDLVARDELLFRFQRLVSTLVNVCLTGRPNFWSSYQKTFLRMFANKTVSIVTVAAMLKKELAEYEKEELFSTGQLAVLLAIEKCESNLATTIVICFKDLIYKMIKDPSSRLNIDINECASYEDTTNIDDNLALEIFVDTLTEEEQKYVKAILEGKKSKIPPNLKVKFEKYLKEI